MTEPSIEQPAENSVWRHQSGRLYRVLFLTNLGGDGGKYPYTVVYVNHPSQTGLRWSGPLSDWHRRMTLVNEETL
jgi:hypothetical protein